MARKRGKAKTLTASGSTGSFAKSDQAPQNNTFQKLKRGIRGVVESGTSALSKNKKRKRANAIEANPSKKVRHELSVNADAITTNKDPKAPAEVVPIVSSENESIRESSGFAMFAAEDDFIALDEEYSDVAESIQTTFKDYEADIKNNSQFYGTGDMISDDDDDDEVESSRYGGNPEYPWMKGLNTGSYHTIADRLTAEIKKYTAYVSPTKREVKQRTEIVDTIRKVIQKRWPQQGVNAYVFGSFATNLYLPGSDIDMVIISKSRSFWETRSSLYQLSALLRQESIGTQIEVIAKARVPIVKFKDAKYGIPIDISFERLNGLEAVKTINQWLKDFPAVRELALVIKRYLAKRRLNEVHTGGLGGFSIICMIVAFLKMHPRIASKDIIPEHNLGVLLIEFFEFYGLNFNYDDLALDPHGTAFLRKRDVRSLAYTDHRDENAMRLVIRDPNDATNNLSRGSFNIRGIKKALGGAFNMLSARCYELKGKGPKRSQGISVLGSIIDIKDKSRQFQHAAFLVNVNAEMETQPLDHDDEGADYMNKDEESIRSSIDSVYVFDGDESSSDHDEYFEQEGLNKENEVINLSDTDSASTSEFDSDTYSPAETGSRAQRSKSLDKDVSAEEDSKVKQTSIDKEKRRQYWTAKAVAL